MITTHRSFITPYTTMRSTVGKNYGQLSELKIRAMLQSGMKIGKSTSQTTGMKLDNLTVKGNQAPAPLWYDAEVQYMT